MIKQFLFSSEHVSAQLAVPIVTLSHIFNVVILGGPKRTGLSSPKLGGLPARHQKRLGGEARESERPLPPEYTQPHSTQLQTARQPWKRTAGHLLSAK